MNLPYELLDEILSCLSLDDEQDRQSLRICSLVAKSWTSPCRRRLFKVVKIREEILQSWLDSIPPTNDELLRHVRSLSYVTDTSGRQFRVDVLRDYLPSFRHLQHLTLSYMEISSDISERVEIYSAFRHTLSRLSVEYCYVTTSAIVTLLNYLPRLDRLDLTYLLHKTDDKPTPPLSRPPIRELHISELDSRRRRNALHIFDQLSELGPLFDEVVVGGWPQVPLSTLSRNTGALGANIKRLGLLQSPIANQLSDASTLLSRFRELQELELVVAPPGGVEAEILSSIRSTGIRKVILVYRLWVPRNFKYDVDWDSFDKPLCRLVDQSECTRRLEVDIQIAAKRITEAQKDTEVARIVDSLAGFREKGQLRIVWVGQNESESVVYPDTDP